MRKTYLLITFAFFLSASYLRGEIDTDQDSNYYYFPKKARKQKLSPALIYLSCPGATKKDLDSIKIVGDSLGFILAASHKAKKRQSFEINEREIMKLYQRLRKRYPVDSSRVFLYGFSAMGVSALYTLFRHPDKFRGVISVCGHSQALPFAQFERLRRNLFYLITRKRDWNLNENQYLHLRLQGAGLRDTLVITEGEHEIGDWEELLKAGQWLERNSRR